MAKLICDICGTSYSASDDKCPTCGYARAFAESAAEEEQTHTVREKVRGGRFSKKNVRKRMKAQEAAGTEPENCSAVAEMAFELDEAVAAADFRPEEILVPEPENDPELPDPQADVPDTPAADEPVLVPLDEAFDADAEPEEELDAAPVIVMDWPVQEPEEAESAEYVIPVLIPDWPEQEAEDASLTDEEAIEPIEVEVPTEEEEPEDEVGAIPLILPVEEDSAPEAETEEPELPAEGEEKKKKRGILVRNIVLFTAVAAFLLSLAYLLVQYGIPYLKDFEWPTQAVVETVDPTDAPTDAPTEAPTDEPTEEPTDPPTDPPTEAPTDPPTEAPTDPPTDPPTEAPTDPPPLAVPLTLNYYELTFRGRNQGVILKVDGYRSSDITWTSDNPEVVTINEKGKIISVGPGTTYVHASYGGHTVSCIVYCKFS